jgi:parvulin-like peptidyl-prolyl isomerase
MIGQFKQMFSLAQAAQAEGLEKTDDFKRQLALMSDQLLENEAQKRNLEIKYTPEEGKAYLAKNTAAFDADLKMITAGSPQQPTPEQVEMMKDQWSELKVRSEKARQAGLDKDPAFLIQQKFRRANLLANQYSNFLEKKFKPTPEEIKQYLTEHPEADGEKIKEKAEGLLQRLKNGENFEDLAKQFTEDGSREKGGDLDWFGKGRMDPEFEKVAFSLQPGQTSELVKTRFGYHIIRVDGRRKATPKPAAPGATPTPTPSGDEEEIRARHIYLSTQEADSVESKIAQKKVTRAMEDASLKYPVAAPEDFKLNVAGLSQTPRSLPTPGGRMITPGPNR